MKRHFISYPKSGRTWIRYMLAQLQLHDAVEFHHDGFEFNDGTRPAHSFDVEARLREYAAVDKLVYLERDPRDVMVSLYFQITGRFRDFFGYGGSISEFIRDDYFGAHNLERFRSMWAEITARHGSLRITYEQCHTDPAATLDAVLSYYGFDVDAPRIVEAVANAEFSNMKRLEETGSFPDPWLRRRNDSPKMRHGKVGAFRAVLGLADIAYLNGVFALPAD